MKKKVGVLLAGIASVGLVAGCGSAGGSTNTGNSQSSSSSGKTITLEFFNRYPNQPYHQFFQTAIQDFEKQNPNVKINEVDALNNDYKQKIDVVLGSNNAPDIYFSWGGAYAYNFVSNQRALDLTPYIQKDTAWSSQLIESQFGAYTFNGKTYGVPVYMDAKVMMYNQDIFKKLNLTPPTTLSQLLADCKVLKNAGYIPIAFGDQENWAVGHYLTTLNQRIVAPKVLQADANPQTGAFTDPGYITALQDLQKLIPYFTPDANAVSDSDAQSSFLQQKAAMYYNETIGLSALQGATFSYSWFNFPSVSGGQGDPKELTGAPEGYMISPTTKHPNTAMKFLEFMTSKPEAEKMVKITQWASTVKGAVNAQDANAHLIQAAKTIEAASNMTMWLDDNLNSNVVDPYLNGAQQLINGQETPQQVMHGVQQAAAQLKQTGN
jgi:raffinose/stachyose/melibiose transport system substrate-binding protein